MTNIDEQVVQFCEMDDGARLAYSTIGDGPPIVIVRGWVGHLELDLENALFREPVEILARQFAVTRYDKRGTGLSDRSSEDFSSERRLRDLERLVDSLRLGRLGLIGVSEGGPTAIAYSAKHANRVSDLILYGAFSRGMGLGVAYTKSVMLQLIRREWGKGSELLADLFMRHAPVEDRDFFERYQQASASPRSAAKLLDCAFNTNVSDQLAAVKMRTLVIHVKGDRVVPYELGRELAAGIEGARLVTVGGYRHIPTREVTRSIYEKMADFLTGTEVVVEGDEHIPGDTVSIVFLDISRSTELTEELGDAQFLERKRGVLARTKMILESNGGVPVKLSLGDGVAATFTSVEDAVVGSLRACKAAAGAGLPLHGGVHHGQVVVEDNTIHGGAVNLTSRIEGEAPSGEVYVSSVVAELLRNSQRVRLAPVGERLLRGYRESTALFQALMGEKDR